MDKLLPHHDYVGRTYGTSGLKGYGYDYEMERLERHSPVEHRMTLRYLDRFVLEGSSVADVGVGVGHDSECLARRGCTVTLVDVHGNLPAHPEGHPSTMHMTTIEELQTECGEHFDELLLAGTESFTSLNQDSFLVASQENQERWLDIVEQTAPTPEGLGIADHPLFVGRKCV